MTRIDGIIILDSNGKPLISSHFALHPPSYPSLHIDSFNTARKKAMADDEELEPVIWVNTLARGGGSMSGAALCHVQREGLCFLVPVGQEVNPLFAFSFLDAFLDTLKDYLGEITESAIKDNFDIIYMLIEEMLDEGHPMTMETNMLKEIVLPPTLMRKLLNVAGVSGLQTPTTQPFTAPIPWRRPGVRHSTNEIYFDIEESLDAIIDKRGNVLSSAVWGRINCNSRLSGNPDLLLNFANPKVLDECAFHPCIRYNKWEKSRILSFIPPDGKFRLLEYQAVASTSKNQIPIGVKANLVVEPNGGRFSITLSSRLSGRPLEDIVLSIYLGKGATAASATAQGDRKPIGVRTEESVADGHVGGGTWQFDPHTQVFKWNLASLVTTERSPTLTGSFASSEAQPTPSPSFDVSFNIQHHSFSNLRVDQLKVTGDVMYKPFKGVRQLARSGKIEVRW
ncbi:uncharacterized protein I303_103538 [Kwoniella dejecticola CBS 10117]|uniref:AP-3 complex subunit mu n=1 Tax=Kwoniella dejecticola CBS 10117 TaxID=1296121 RepID=A0A1A6A712_9TREE|nr:AP-3 complex subunit mu [Kwoniella dejecticola CBS 10117]OBR85847.1 AP-3 complex subunit mu [Kwoniella dejecticola CBS 10117]